MLMHLLSLQSVLLTVKPMAFMAILSGSHGLMNKKRERKRNVGVWGVLIELIRCLPGKLER